MKPYIGITDFTDLEQVRAMLDTFELVKSPASDRMLHVGVMMSYKSLHDLPSKWQYIYPPKGKIASIFGSSKTYNCLHYADYDDNSGLWDSLARAITFGGEGMHALQLDMIWPNPDEISQGIRISGRHVEVVLQIGRHALEEVGNDPRNVVARLKNYDGVIHRVLLDKSMGRGVGMDARALLPYATAIRDAFPKLGIGAAGGLGPHTVHLVEPLADEFPDISIDAQSRLRPSSNALDPVDWEMAAEYVIKALEILD